MVLLKIYEFSAGAMTLLRLCSKGDPHVSRRCYALSLTLLRSFPDAVLQVV
jgi:hypothetical protein